MNEKIYNLGRNAELRRITESSIITAATKISGENPAGMGENEVIKRHSLATRVINGSQNQAIIFAKTVASQVGFYSIVDINEDGSLNYTGTQTLDEALNYTVETVWSDVAGVSYSDEQVS